MSSTFVTGYSLKAPNANDLKTFYEAVRDKTDLTQPSRRYPEGYLDLPPRAGTLPQIDAFDNEFFKYNIKQTDKMDIIIRLLLEVTHEALLDAKISIPNLRGSRTGVYVGHCFSDYLGRTAGHDVEKNGYELVNGAHTMAANKISFFYDLKGPSLVFDTACSSSLVALHQANQDLKAGLIDRAIVGGASLTLDPNKNKVFQAYSMLSPTGRCHSFDARADGYCRAEGIAVVILEAPSVCQNGYARLLGSSVNSDGFTAKGITFPSGRDQAANARDAFKAAALSPEAIGYVEAHGTGTVAGDSQELGGLINVLYGEKEVAASAEGEEEQSAVAATSPRQIPIGSIKSVMGHAEGASGLMSLIKVLLMYEHKQLLPNQLFNYDPTDPTSTNPHAAIKEGFFKVVEEVAPWEPRPACISNYGFGGTNAFAIVAPGNVEITESPAVAAPLTFAPTFGSQATSAGDDAWFQEQAVLGNDSFYAFRDGRKSAARPAASKVAFVFSGQGAQWPEMGRAMMETSEIFRDTIARLDGFVRAVDDKLRLFEWFSGSETTAEGAKEASAGWMNKQRSGLGITAYQIALVNMLRASNVHPDFVLGHSLGEVGASYASGLQTEKQTIEIAIVRSGLSSYILPNTYMLKTKTCLDESELLRDGVVTAIYSIATKDAIAVARKSSNSIAEEHDEKYYFYYVKDSSKIPAEYRRLSHGEHLFDLNGSMVAVGLESAVIQAAIDELGLKQTCVACYNSPQGQTVSGAEPEVARLKVFLEKRHPDLFWRDVPTDKVAYHAPHLSCHYEMLVAQFSRILGETSKLVPPSFVCTSTNHAVTGGKGSVLLDAHFHARNIVNPVYFQQALESLPRDTLIVEVGPHQGLLGQIKRVRADFSTLGLIKAGAPQTELQVGSALSRVFYAAGYSKHIYAPSTVNRGTRLPLSKRHPDLWNHTRVQKVFDYSDYEMVYTKSADGTVARPTSSNVTSGGFELRYDIGGEHKFLLDHTIQGQPLFPATGHLFSFWSAIGLDKAVNISEFEILQPVPLDPTAVIFFAVHKAGNEYSITNDGNVVARAVIIVVQDGSAAAPAPASDVKVLDPVAAAASNQILDGNSLYNHFKRYGYEYNTAFRLVNYRTLPTSLRGDAAVAEPEAGVDGYAVLNTAVHIIAWLDVMLQLFLDDLRLLRLPTLLKRAHLRPSLLTAALKDSSCTVFIDTATKRLFNEHALFQELHTLPATKARAPCRLVHSVQTFVPLGVHVLEDARAAALLANSADITAAEAEQVFATPAPLLEQLVAVVSQEFESSSIASRGLRVLEGGVGFGAFTRRLFPAVSGVLDTYTAMDSAAAKVEEFAGDARFETLVHDLNEPFEELALEAESQKYHLFAASNASRATSDFSATLLQLTSRIHDGGFLLLEEVTNSAFGVHLFGPDATASRSFEEIELAVAQVAELELIVAFRTQVRATLLLRRRSAESRAAAALVENKTEWADIVPTATPAHRIVSDGALALFRTLVKEYSNVTLQTATLDAKNENSVRLLEEAAARTPLRHLAVRQNQVGTYVTTSPAALVASAVVTAPEAAVAVAPTDALSLSIKRPGDLGTLTWAPMPLRQAQEGDRNKTVNVEFAGLNFKDVMYAFGKLRLETPSFGLEVSGHDQQGQRVMGIGRCNCIATKTVLDMTWPIPAEWSLADAATVPVVYLTALYAMFHRARLEPGQTMLVHGGAGGVGHAAIHLAQRHGIEVFTTCSNSKRAHLKEWFGLDDDHIGNSRDLSFVDLVLRGTNGQGVDMVLNSLSGAALSSSFTLVKEYGSFCEIGKFDLQTNTHVGLKVFERNVAYYAIDLATMFAHAHYSQVLVKLLQKALDDGDVRPLPFEVYAAIDAADALRYLSAGKQVGKVLIGMQNAEKEVAGAAATAAVEAALAKTALPSARGFFTTTGTHIITGGLGGFGMELAHWLVLGGARRVVLTSRTGKLVTGWQQMRFATLQGNPVLDEAVISTADVGDAAQCKQLIATYAADSELPLRGVWHAAMVLEDVTFAKQTAQRWDTVHYAKSVGCAHLDRAVRRLVPDLQVFCAFSSVVALQGNIGQAAYAHANAACERIVQQRNADGLSGVAIQWGAIDNVGFVSQNASQIETSIAQYALQNIDDSLECLHQWAQHRGVVSSFCELDKEVASAGADSAVGVNAVEDVQAKFASILGGKAGDYDPDTPVQTYGLDSLSSTVLVNWINNNQAKGSAHGHITAEFFDDAMTIRKMFTHMTA